MLLIPLGINGQSCHTSSNNNISFEYGYVLVSDIAKSTYTMIPPPYALLKTLFIRLFIRRKCLVIILMATVVILVMSVQQSGEYLKRHL